MGDERLTLTLARGVELSCDLRGEGTFEDALISSISRTGSNFVAKFAFSNDGDGGDVEGGDGDGETGAEDM